MGLTRTSKSKSKVSRAGRRERNFAWTPSARDRFARAEPLALTIWPWHKLTLEVEATDAIVGLPHDTEARTPRALWWGTLQLFGDDDGEAFNTIFQCATRKVQKDEWKALCGVSPITANETLIGRAVAFVAVAREGLDGMAVHDIDADWVRIEDPRGDGGPQARAGAKPAHFTPCRRLVFQCVRNAGVAQRQDRPRC